ncbi:MAG TPA: hypothetical protein VFW45_13645 [Candidatus Polarisedimenticolia bacterium]|nr:hypothetical protein [Candidatus Polarisedimenticolia bacterium]
MNRKLRSTWAVFACCVLIAVLAGVACAKKDEQAATNEEGSQIASNDTTAPPEPAATDPQPAQPEPAQAQPAPARKATSRDFNTQPMSAPPAPPAPATVTINVPAGTPIKVKFDEELNSGVNQVGDTFHATLVDPILSGDRVALPDGSTVEGKITEVVPAKKGLKESGGMLGLSFDRVTTPSGVSAAMSASFSEQAKSTAKKGGTIGGAAAGGAILGKVLGGDTKDAALGAVVGGAIGTGIAAGTKGTEMKIKSGTEVTITLDQPLAIKLRR